MYKLTEILLWLILAPTTLFLLAGYLGAMHPVFDSIAVFRLYAMALIVVVLLLSLTIRKTRLAIFCALVSVLAGVSMVPILFTTQVGNGEGIVILQSNLNYRNSAELLGPYAERIDADIITLQEVTSNNRNTLDDMLSEFPSYIFCDFASVGGVAVLSKFPMAEPEAEGCLSGKGVTWLRVQTPDGPLTIASVHLHWPWPYGQASQVPWIIAELETLSQPMLVAGDFNMVPWGNAVNGIERASGTETINGIRFSLSLMTGLIQLPIDHILIPTGSVGLASRGPQLGSDHHSVYATIKLTP